MNTLTSYIAALTPPSPPETGGEGVDEVSGFFYDGKASNRSQLFSSPPMGERVRVRGK